MNFLSNLNYIVKKKNQDLYLKFSFSENMLFKDWNKEEKF